VRAGAPWPLLRLHLRLWAAASRQWLLSIGLMPDRDAPALGYAYAAYALALGLLWIGASWGALVRLTLEFAGILPPQALALLRSGLPGLFGLLLVALAAGALVSMPLHLSGPDVQHLSGARISLRWLTGLRFAPAALAVAALTLPVGTVLAVLASGSPRHYLLAMAVLLPLAFGAYAWAWAIGLLRLSVTQAPRRALLWLIPVALLALLALHVPLLLWPGQAFAAAALAGSAQWPALLLWFVAGLLAMLWAAGHVHRSLLLDRSLRRSLLRSIDAGRRWNAPVALQQRRAAILSRRRPVLRLPQTEGLMLLPLRAALARLRYPSSLWGLWRLATILIGGVNLAVLPTQGYTWLLWLLIAFVYPPGALAEDFQADTDPQWRQLLHLPLLRLLLGDALLPGGIVLLAGAVEISFLRLGAAGTLEAILLLLGLIAATTLAQAVGAVARQGRGMPLPDVLPGAIAYALFALVGVLLHAVLIASLLLLVYSAVLAWLVADADGPHPARA